MLENRDRNLGVANGVMYDVVSNQAEEDSDMTDDHHQKFTERYASNSIPWDTGITPPEIVSVVAELPAGKAIDLGCGTGTNVRYLLEHGWRADGVDFIAQAVEMARAKLAKFPADAYTVVRGDVTQLEQCEGLHAPYDLAIDIGCGHAIEPEKQPKYAQDVAGLLKPSGIFMFYAHFPHEGRTKFGLTEQDVHRLFTPHFEIVWQVLGIDTMRHEPSGWYRMVKR
jgi:SAM-dependent methyltransferase